MTLNLNGVSGAAAQVNTLHGGSWWATNTIEKPDAIRPVASRVRVQAANWKHTLPPNTIEVLDIPLK